MASPVPGLLATPADLKFSYPELCQDIDPALLQSYVAAASANIEERTSRRLAPFSGHIYDERLFGIDPDEYGGGNADMPIDIFGALGASYAQALGASRLVRHFWLDQFAPFYPELWTYNIQSMKLYLTYGNFQDIDFQHGGLIGNSPSKTDGHAWIRLGTFSPEGTRVEVVYGGGYTVSIPVSLKRACLFQAAKFIILEAEPQSRSHMDMNELDHQTELLIAPWVRA